MKATINNGATYWPSADFHGTADPTVGIALARGYFENRVATRASTENVLHIFDGTEEIGIFSPSSCDPSAPTEETSSELQALADEGKIKGVGPGEAD
ncbi:hypothetical protein F4823DRAFT_562649 [Ustulina deusta]|nr:hypothetical protein F4823DRAFT_562649 [Ustulina deusta]